MNYVLSQLLHGEQAALQLCGQLTSLCPTTDEKWYAANQVFDEARHVEALSKFLTRKMGQALENWGELNSLVYMHTVVPNLVRLGLVTERTESRWRELGMLSDVRQAPRSELPLTA
jgi:hypothetical protein